MYLLSKKLPLNTINIVGHGQNGFNLGQGRSYLYANTQLRTWK